MLRIDKSVPSFSFVHSMSSVLPSAFADVFLLEHCKSLRSDLKSSATQPYRGAKQYMKIGNNTSEIPENRSYPASGCSWVKAHSVATILAFATKCTTSRSS